MKTHKIYATINRSGTTVRVKPNCQQLLAFIEDRERYMETQPPLDDKIDATHFVEKEIWQRIASELKIGFKENHTQISFRGRKDTFIIANKAMRKEVMEILDIATEAKKQREDKQKKFQEAQEAEKEERTRRENELREKLGTLSDDMIVAIRKEGPQEAISKYGHLLTSDQIDILREMAKVKY